MYMFKEDLIEDAPAPATTDEAPRERHREYDQFYTNPDVVEMCMELIRGQFGDLGQRGGTWIEPSSGTGAFLSVLPAPRIGIDLEPKDAAGEGVEGNFLEWRPGMLGTSADLARPVTLVGNPPFGRNASLAIRFVNRAVELGFDAVCFILPRTFQKEMTRAKVHDLLHCVVDVTLPANSFTHRDRPYDVPCCFQIWRRMPDNARRTTDSKHLDHPHFDIVGKDDEADFTFQRVGARAGDVSFEGLSKSWKSHHRIKVREGVTVEELMKDLSSLEGEWAEIRARTAGNPSIGKRELIEHYDAFLEREGRKVVRASVKGTLGI